MNALVKKEIRLLLPGWAAVLLLETALPWFGKDGDAILAWMPVAFFFGLVILAVDVFGREFNPGIFQSLMAQPIERQRIWRTKVSLLLAAAGLIFLCYAISCGLRVAVTLHESMWRNNANIIWHDYYTAVAASILLLVVALSGGLWTALLLRQTAAAFWITFLTPTAILMTVVFLLPEKLAGNGGFILSLMIGLSMAYSLGGFWFARRLFFRAQDVAWTGGVINFSRWRYFERSGRRLDSVRRRRPWLALWKKEVQLHSMSLFCASALVALHLLVFLVRAFYANAHRNSLVGVFTEYFWSLWLIMPLILGCVAVAEERKLGVMDEQFSLPVSRRRLFIIKLLPVMLLGVFLGAVLPLLLEGVAARVGLPNEFFKLQQPPGNQFIDGSVSVVLGMVSSAAGLTLLSYFASTMTRSFLQALGLAIAGSVLVVVMFGSAKDYLEATTPLPLLIAVPVIPGVLLWRAWRNFDHYQDDWRLWLRNILGLVAALAFVALSSAAVYNRVWEIFEPVEPPHGPARMSLATAPKLDAKVDGDLLVEWPDGRVWYDVIGYHRWYSETRLQQWRYLWAMMTRPLPDNNGPGRFVQGSNWVSVTVRHGEYPVGQTRVWGYRDTVGVKSDGTLWISAAGTPGHWNGDDMRQVGDETNWLKVVPLQLELVLLKKGGTLWQCPHYFEGIGTSINRPSPRDFSPVRIGAASDWDNVEADEGWESYARKSDGSVWRLKLKSSGSSVQVQLEPMTNVEQVDWEKFSRDGSRGREAFVGPDGVLRSRSHSDAKFAPIGVETNWVAVSLTWVQMIALKTDGTLWQWKLSPDSGAPFPPNEPPVKLGIHQDWVALGKSWYHPVSLAADGSLWVWPDARGDSGALMRPPKQPKNIGNVFQTAN